MRPLIFRRQARSEYDEAGDWYEKERAGLGVEFLAEIDRLLQRIADNPEQFPYCVYFRERNHSIVVMAVFHSARNPAVWQKRA